MDKKEIISKLKMIPLPKEGGWFRELRHSLTCGMPELPLDMGPVGQVVEGSSSIYYFLSGCEVSKWHCLSVDEYWCFHCGETIRYLFHVSVSEFD